MSHVEIIHNDSVLKALIWLFLQNMYLYPQILTSSLGITEHKNMNENYFFHEGNHSQTKYLIKFLIN